MSFGPIASRVVNNLVPVLKLPRLRIRDSRLLDAQTTYKLHPAELVRYGSLGGVSYQDAGLQGFTSTSILAGKVIGGLSGYFVPRLDEIGDCRPADVFYQMVVNVINVYAEWWRKGVSHLLFRKMFESYPNIVTLSGNLHYDNLAEFEAACARQGYDNPMFGWFRVPKDVKVRAIQATPTYKTVALFGFTEVGANISGNMEGGIHIDLHLPGFPII